ncbi:TadE/TadG family type IV pilus assembly protein [Afipia sp. TerB]|jgi:Flp pilus assembly protein TadG
MTAPAPPTTRAGTAIRRFRGDRNGSAAIQFAFIAPLFFALMFAIIESSMVFFAGQILETGTADSARLFLTNQAQDKNMSRSDFEKDLCSRVSMLFDCKKLVVSVKAYPKGTAIPAADLDPPIASGAFVNNSTYELGAPESTMVIRAFYQWPLFVTGLGFNIADIGRGTNSSKKLLAATAAFRVEPK